MKITAFTVDEPRVGMSLTLTDIPSAGDVATDNPELGTLLRKQMRIFLGIMVSLKLEEKLLSSAANS